MVHTDYSITVGQLQELVDPKDPEKLEALGGIEGVVKALQSHQKLGLTKEQVAANREKYLNDFDCISLSFHPSPNDLFLLQCNDHLRLFGAAVSLILGIRENPATGWIEGSAILVAVCIVVLVAAINDFEKEKQFRRLNCKKDMKDVKVIRDGVQSQVQVTELVVGDVVVIDTGDIMSGDGIFLSGYSLLCDESTATGESKAIKKGTGDKQDPFFISGTQVMDGMGSMIVIAVGSHSYSGKQMMALREDSDDTPLQVKLGELADDIGFLGLIAAGFTVTCLIARELYRIYVLGERELDCHFVSMVIRFIITGVTILVVAIPEGLPLAVTMSLAYSMVKMCEDQNLVRRLEACETMGGATQICSDKTGTLTQNVMTVVKGYIAGEHFDSVDDRLKDRWSDRVLDLIGTGLSVNSTASQIEGQTTYMGSKTEGALLDMVQILGVDYKAIRSTEDIVCMFPFSSNTKQMSTLVRINATTLRHYVKGAPENLIANDEYYIDSKGTVKPMTGEIRAALLREVQFMSQDALRTMAFSYVDIPDCVIPDSPPTNRSVHIGLVGIEDPIRPEVPAAVRTCQKAGIMVRMVTGDNLETAISVATRCGIYDENRGGLAMEGREFRAITDQHRREQVVFRLQVLARSSPLDKQMLVQTLMDMGEVVAVTGDGTNDGPALKLAHVGFSMGLTGTEVAKEASDIVLMDDNFSSIVKAVMWGRNVFDSIKKFIQFQLTVNVVAVSLAFVGSITHDQGESPLKPVQLLWVNLIMDSMAALALATERPTEKLLKRLPLGKRAPLITTTMWLHIIGQSVLQCIILGIMLYRPGCIGLESLSKGHLTMFFNTFVFLQIFNEFNARKLHGELNVFEGLDRSPLFAAVITFTLVIQYLMVQYGGDFIGCQALTFHQWMVCIGIASLTLPVGLFIRTLPPLYLPASRTKCIRNRWKGAIYKTRQQIGVVEAFRRKHSVDTHNTVKTTIAKK
eukprot:Ihof_evm4s196 gene=Ihof_evmTU4s196